MGLGQAILSALPIVGEGLSQYFASETARQNTDKTIAANKELAQYQYSKDLEMWNRGNEYNSPSAQMSRLKQAGLNPNLVYGSGVTGNTAANLPKYQAPRVEYNYRPVDVTGMLSFYQDTMIKQAQYDNLRAQHDAITQGTRLKQFEGDLFNDTYFARGSEIKDRAMLLRQRRDWMREHSGELFSTQLEALKSGNRQKEVFMNNLEQQIRLNRQKADWYMWDTLGNLGGKVGNMLRAILLKK